MDVCKKLRRLPEDIEPYHYEITITPDIENLTFKGEVQIFFQVKTSFFPVFLNFFREKIQFGRYINITLMF